MRPALSRLLRGVGRVCNALAWRIYEPPEARRVRPWFRDRGDQTLRLQYDLTPESVVFDLGGYEGQWTSDVAAMYACTVFVFEPVPEFADQIARRFRANPKVRVFPFGLAPETTQARMHLNKNSSSLFTPGRSGQSVPVELRRAADFLAEHQIRAIDLLKINIEGGEYDLLEHLLAVDFMRHIRDLQVQFHDFVPEAASRRAAIQQALTATHALTYQYPWVWENWRRRAAEGEAR